MSTRNRRDNGGGNDEGKKPVKSYKAWTGSGNIEVAIFEHQKEGRSSFSTTWHKSWKETSTGQWQKGQTLFARDLLVLARLLEEAWSFISIQEQS